MEHESWARLVDAAVQSPASARQLVLGEPQALEARGPLGETPLHFSCVEGFVEGVRSLIALGANVNAKNRLGDAPLHDLAALGEVELVRLLLDAGADPLQLSTDAETPLHVACDHGQRGVVELLTARGLRAWSTKPGMPKPGMPSRPRAARHMRPSRVASAQRPTKARPHGRPARGASEASNPRATDRSERQ